jgi:predicted PurR-regulated permease PerM
VFKPYAEQEKLVIQLPAWIGVLCGIVSTFVAPILVFVGKLWGQVQELRQRVSTLEEQLKVSAIDRKELRDMAHRVETSTAKIETAIEDMKLWIGDIRKSQEKQK